jgi:hypothetical protein
VPAPDDIVIERLRSDQLVRDEARNDEPGGSAAGRAKPLGSGQRQKLIVIPAQAVEEKAASSRAASMSSARPNRLIVSWNAYGAPLEWAQ